AGSIPCRKNRRGPSRNNDVRLATRQFGGSIGDLCRAGRQREVDDDALAFNETFLDQAFPEAADIARRRRANAQEADAPELARLLSQSDRPRGACERPSHPGADERDELTSSHWRPRQPWDMAPAG